MSRQEDKTVLEYDQLVDSTKRIDLKITHQAIVKEANSK